MTNGLPTPSSSSRSGRYIVAFVNLFPFGRRCIKAVGENPAYTGEDTLLHRVAKRKIVLEVKAISHVDD